MEDISLELRTVNQIEVRDAIRQLKKLVGITMTWMPRFLLISQIIESGVFPACLKISKIIPIHKGGSTHVVANFRPIALIPIRRKVLELILKKQLPHFLETNDLNHSFCIKSRRT